MRFWTDKTWREYKDDERWATLRVKRDAASGEDYFDVLVGKIGQPAHAHLGIALDQTLLFAEYRGVVHKIGRKIESQQKGMLENKERVVNPDIPPGRDLIFKVNLNPTNGHITIVDFGLKDERNCPA